MKKHQKICSIAAILSLYFIGAGTSAINPAMAKLADEFSRYDYTLIATIPPLFMVPGIMITGFTAERYIKYRTLAGISCILYLIGGVTPVFLSSFHMIILCRAIFGLGVGILAPLGNTLVIRLAEQKSKAKYMGYGAVAMNIGGILQQLFVGQAATHHTRWAFLCYLIAFTTLICMIFLPEPKPEPGVKEAKIHLLRVSKGTWKKAGMIFIMNMAYQPVILNIALIFRDKALGGVEKAAFAMTVYTISGCIAGIVFGNMLKRIQKNSIALGMIICGIGAFSIVGAEHYLSMMISAIIAGFGYTTFTTSFFTFVGVEEQAEFVVAATSLTMIFMNLGAFTTTFWLKILDTVFKETLYHAILFTGIIFLAAGGAFLIRRRWKD